jgi:acetyl-CoA C-acetyltransferase
MSEEVVILSGSRTAIGSFGGSLKSTSNIELGTLVADCAIKNAGIEREEIEQVVFGHVINTEPKDMYLSRVIALKAGMPTSVVAMNVNRLCGSVLQALVSLIQTLSLGDAKFGLAGGAENMSRSPHILNSNRWGKRMGDSTIEDMMLGALNCPFDTGHMGITAENVAEQYNITRDNQDAFALESQKRALNAIKKGYFSSQITPVEIGRGSKATIFEVDEHPKETNEEGLSSLRPVFRKNGTVTAGNSSGLNDGAAAIVLGTKEASKAMGLKIRARVRGYAHSGVRPEVMGIGPITAVKKLLEKVSLSLKDFDVIESNEAFASQACAVSKELDFDPEIVNPNGGAIALGHPIGATGAILAIKALNELERIDGSLGLITMCIGGGQGIALAIERS